MKLSKILILIIIVGNIIGNSLSDAFIKVSEMANPAVVSIIGKQNIEQSYNNDPFYRHFGDFFEMPENYGTSLGSGVIIDANNGYILTNNHVIKEADEITVTLYDKREYIADVIGTDKLSDLALLQINARNLSDIKLGNSDMLKVGEWVVAIGNPFQQSLSNLSNAYKHSEIIKDTKLGIFSLGSLIMDRPDPGEALSANTVWVRSNINFKPSLSSTNNTSANVYAEVLTGAPGSYFINSQISMF